MMRELKAGLPDDVELGGKARGLVKLLNAGARVPRAFVLGAEHFATTLPTPVREALKQTWEALGGQPVAVRSSGIDEDGAVSSFAGQFDTVLNVSSLEALEAAVVKCWASAHSERVTAYRAHVGAGEARLAVIVQQMVQPRLAGVVFTQAPNGARGEMAIEAVEGLGEALVSGRSAPVPLAAVDRERLETEARALERHFGEPLDLEWALAADGQLFWLQARPITTSVSQSDPHLVWSNTNAGELLPDVATPMTLDVVERVVRMLFASFTEDLGVDWDRTPLIGLVGGRIYFCMNTFLAISKAVPGMASKNPAELFGGHAQEILDGLAKVKAAEHPVVRVSGRKLVSGVLSLVGRMLLNLGVRPDAEVQRIVADTKVLSAVQPTTLSDEALLAHLERLNGGLGPAFHDVFAAIAVGMACTNATLQVCQRWLGDADGSRGSSLFSGLGGVDSAESALALWRLGEALRGLPLGSWAELEPTLTPALRAQWNEWMERHGHHARAELDISQPRWREVPDQVLATLRAWSAGAQLAERTAAIERRRVDVEAASFARLGPLKRAVLRALLERGRRGTRLRERLKSESVRRIGLSRLALHEVGARLVQRGAVERVDDVFFLRLRELGEALGARSGVRWTRLVARRRAEHRQWLPLQPPPVVVGVLDPASALPPPVPDATVLRGLAVSGGVVEGIARVVLRADDETRVAPGEILVAPFTDPGWAPYFVAASALVVDLGGMLSHGSIIAREYGIPAVVNVGHGTRRITSGSRIRVDGFRGEVTILE